MTEVATVRVGDYRGDVLETDGKFVVQVRGYSVRRRNNLGGAMDVRWVRCTTLEPQTTFTSAADAVTETYCILKDHGA